MQSIRTLNDMIVFLQQRGDKRRVAVVCANDASTRYAVEKGKEMGFIEPIYVDGEDKEECARRAVALCKSGEADILMKGLINTDVLLRAILDKEKGIIRPGHVLTHVAMAEIPKYEKLLFFTDAAVIPVPTEAQRRQQIHYMNYVCHALGIEEPRISLIHCAEKVSAKTFPYTVDYLEIMNFCGYDMDKAHEMAKQRGTEDFSELLKRMRGSTQQEQEGKDVHILPA